MMNDKMRMALELQTLASRLHVIWWATIEAGTDKDISNCILDVFHDVEGFLSELEEEEGNE